MEPFKYRPGETPQDFKNELLTKLCIDWANKNIAAGNAKSNVATLGEIAQDLAADGYACSADTKLEFI